MTDCYAKGNVSKNTPVKATGNYRGGFVGSVGDATEMKNCYATGLVASPSSLCGGFIGYVRGDAIITVTNCYYDKDASGFPSATDAGKGTPLSTADMKIEESYDGWEFGLIWSILEGFNDGYPSLQNMPL